jgi:hypothetical protein
MACKNLACSRAPAADSPANPLASPESGKAQTKWERRTAEIGSGLWPTPRAGTDTMCGGPGHWKMLQGTELETGRGQLNPRWVEWLMGIPIGWLSLKPLAMDRFRQWRQQHGVF